MATTRIATSSPVIQDNKQQHRDWLDQTEATADAKCGRTAGFEYAIQPDGTSFAERAWRERRERSMAFTFLSSDPEHTNHYQSSSLAQIERASKEHAPRNSSQHLNSQPMSMLPPKSPYPSSDVPSTTAPFLSPTRRIRNHHNAVFGQHLPNALNSPSCAKRVFGKHAAMKEEQTLCMEIMHQQNNGKENINDDHVDDLFMDLDVDKLVAERRNHQNRRISELSAISFAPSEEANTPQGYDGTQMSRHNSSFEVPQSPPAPAFYDLCDTSNDDSTKQQRSTVANHSQGHSNSFVAQSGDYQQQVSFDKSRASRDGSHSFSATSGGYQYESRNHCDTSLGSSESGGPNGHLQQPTYMHHTQHLPNPYSQPKSFGGINESMQQPSMKNPYSRDPQNRGNLSFESSNSVGGNSDTFRQQLSMNSRAQDFDNQGSSNAYDLRLENGSPTVRSAAFDSHQNNTFASSDQSFQSAIPPWGSTHDAHVDLDTPLCPTHNQPCRLLTARSEANAGRHFYKCSVADQGACDFFQWADDNEGNWNGHETRGYAPPGGDVLDHHVENRRKFGHSSFRPGQKEVIENALKGRDVFVLMPTGGGKSLCYQLPAWCCPGLSVVISPLLSLIQDQVQSMTKLGVQSVFLNSAQDYETEQRDIQRRLFATTAHGGVKLLYITPEKLRHSGLIKTVLKTLHERNHISRFVVDEAHCLR